MAKEATELISIGGLLVCIKQTKEPRWVIFSSSSFRDRDGETISLKAHLQDIEHMEKNGDWGVLDWYHLHPLAYSITDNLNEIPASVKEKGLIIGDCDFSAMHGRIRIESGTFRSKQVADAVIEHQEELSSSLLFLHPKNEPDLDGTFWNIHTISRAILPKHRASNLAAQISSLAVQGGR